MAPRPGGEADKLGNKYEAAWAVRHALYCIANSAYAITAEDISEDLGSGSEFTFSRDGLTEVHQVKRQHGNSNYWTVKALASVGVFDAAFTHVAAGRIYYFVSLISCGPLRELADRARRSADVTAFTQSWLTEELRDSFDQLSASNILGSAWVAWTTLRGMRFEVHGEDDIIRMNAVLAERTLNGATGHLVSLTIADVLLDNLGKRLTQVELLDQLAPHGIGSMPLHSRASARDQVRTATDSWSKTVRRELLQPSIGRAEAAQLAHIMKDSRIGLILGTAGGGKSSVLEQAVTSLTDSGTEVLALRLDRFDPFSSTSDLGRQLGLDTSPAAALAIAADGREAFLVIDQLDAVSLASGRMPRSFDVVMDLVDEALSVAGIRVVLACREFDADNDYRIRALSDRPDLRKLQVAPLPVSAVKTAVANMGLNPALLTTTQVALMQIPLHLVLLHSISSQSDALSFQSRDSLYARFWDRKQQSARGRRDGVRFNETVARVANAASDRQILSVPFEVLDEGDLLDDANVLVSEHVLTRDGDRIAFFHETFFDYAFARQWVSRDESLVDFLLRDEQELFRRAQVRQILQHLHEREPDRFRRELEILLRTPDVRFHIKETALAVLANLPSPTAPDVELVYRVASASPSSEDHLWQKLLGGQWFRLLLGSGTIAGWLDGPNSDLQNRALSYMKANAREYVDDVASLLETRSTTADYLDWLRFVLRHTEAHLSRRLFQLLLAAVRGGAYHDHETELWFTARRLAEHQPTWAIELLEARLVDGFEALATGGDGKVMALSVNEYSAIKLVREAATAEPKIFVDAIAPYLLRVMSATEFSRSKEAPFHDRHFSFRLPDNDRYLRRLDEALLSATVRALKTLARSEPITLDATLTMLADDPHDAAQYLLYKALAAGEHAFAEWAAQLLLEGAGRLDCGYLPDSHWVSREVVKAIAPHVTPRTHQLLEDQFRDLHNPDERGSNFGWASFKFLSALAENRLTPTGVRRLQEYKRKFGLAEPPPPQGIAGGSVRSPIHSAAMNKMTDAQWLAAMAKHDQDNRSFDPSIGGVTQLANELRLQVASEVERFARLALQMNAELNPAYGNSFLGGFGESTADDNAELVFAAVAHIAAWGNPHNDRWIGVALRPHLRDAPLDLVKLVLDRTLHSKDPMDTKPVVVRGDEDSRADSLYFNGINATRGILVKFLGDLLVYDVDGRRTALVRPHLSELAADPVVSVRTCVAHTIAASLRHDRPAAYASFFRLIETTDTILAVTGVEQLMVFIGNVNPEVIDPVIQRMLRSADGEAREAGGRLASFAALEWERPELMAQALALDTQVRRGVAYQCAVQLAHTSNLELATSALLQLVDDSDDTVRKAAAELAVNLRGQALRPFAALLKGLIDSPSYDHATAQLLITLEHATDQVDDLALQAAQRFLAVHGDEAADIRTAAAGNADYVNELVVRGLAHSRDHAHRSALLDALDQLVELGVYGIEDAISASERR